VLLVPHPPSARGVSAAGGRQLSRRPASVHRASEVAGAGCLRRPGAHAAPGPAPGATPPLDPSPARGEEREGTMHRDGHSLPLSPSELPRSPTLRARQSVPAALRLAAGVQGVAPARRSLPFNDGQAGVPWYIEAARAPPPSCGPCRPPRSRLLPPSGPLRCRYRRQP